MPSNETGRLPAITQEVSPDDTTGTIQQQYIMLPVAEIGLDRRPTRQVRHLDDEWVRHLALESDPASWPPIIVRPWPVDDPPPAEGPCPYQAISGYHRVSAARLRCLPTIAAIVRMDVSTDADFVAAAVAGNSQHGKPMDKGELQAAVRRLASLGLSQGDIAKQTGIPKGTVHNYLTDRETNAGRLLQTQQETDDTRNGADGQIQQSGKANGAEVVTLTPAQRARIGSALHDLLAVVPLTLTEGELRAWAQGLVPIQDG
jgi:hypothetical protein